MANIGEKFKELEERIEKLEKAENEKLATLDKRIAILETRVAPAPEPTIKKPTNETPLATAVQKGQ